MRSSLETYVDLQCLVDDANYLDVIKNVEIDKEIKYLKHYSTDNNYYSQLDANEQRLEELKKNFDPKKCLNIFQRFEKANEVDAYRTVYNKLCLFSHGNFSALASDNFKNGHVVLNVVPEDPTMEFILSGTLRAAIGATLEILAYFNNEEKILKPFKDLLGLK